MWNWLARKDSNFNPLIQNQAPYRLATRQWSARFHVHGPPIRPQIGRLAPPESGVSGEHPQKSHAHQPIRLNIKRTPCARPSYRAHAQRPRFASVRSIGPLMPRSRTEGRKSHDRKADQEDHGDSHRHAPAAAVATPGGRGPPCDGKAESRRCRGSGGGPAARLVGCALHAPSCASLATWIQVRSDPRSGPYGQFANDGDYPLSPSTGGGAWSVRSRSCISQVWSSTWYAVWRSR
jgi:hypothetical protein